MHRRIARSFFILFCGVLAAGLGVLAAMLFTTPGLGLLARILSDQSPKVLRGSVVIGRVSGGWFSGFRLDSVEIKDTAGVLLLAAPEVQVRYRLANLLAGRVVISEARVLRPEIHIFKHRGGRTNLEEILRLGEKPAGGRPPLVEIRNLEIVDGRVVIRLPWSPDGRLRLARQQDSALAAERARPGRRIVAGPEGLERVRTIEGLNSFFPLLQVATPDRQPITVEIARLVARVSDPELDIREARGRVRTRGDSLLFELERFALPGTEGRGLGRLDWPSDTLLFRFNLQAPRLALADIRFISPLFPDFTGSGRVQATSLSTRRTEYSIRELTVGKGPTRVAGRMVAITDLYRGLGFRGLDVALSELDLDVVRPFLDTLPFHGVITGPLKADGFFDSMTVALDWHFRDAAAGGAESQVALEGPLELGGAQGLTFEGVQVPRADVDLRTVRVVSPAVILEGRLALEGSLSGPLRNVVFQGSAEHRDSTRPRSRLSGRVRLDTRGATLGLDTDVVLDSLVFQGIRRTFPGLPSLGGLGGTLKLTGFLDSLSVDAAVGGALGRVEARGRVTLLPPRWAADSLRLRFERLDLATLLGRGPATSLQGVLSASVVVVDSAVAPEGRLELTLGPGRIRELLLDSAVARLHALDSLVTLDTARAFWREGQLEGGGTLGWRAPKSGTMRFLLAASDLAGLDSLVIGVTGMRPDSAAGEVSLHGRARAEVALQGVLGALAVDARASVDSGRWLSLRAHTIEGHVLWRQHDPSLAVELSADSLWRRRLLFTGLSGAVSGRPDSLGWVVEGRNRDLAWLRGRGYLESGAGRRVFQADSLELELQGRRWTLGEALHARISDSLVVLDTLRLLTRDGSGSVQAVGTLPRRGRGELALTALGVELRDVYSLLQRDTTGIKGVLAVDARLAGTAVAPEMRGSGTLTGAVFGDFQAPLMRAAFDYREQQLRGNLTFWRTGKPVVEANLTVPLDLALQSVPRRQLPGPLDIVIRGDSIDLALAEAFTQNVRQVNGLLEVDARVQGTWEAPRLAGRIDVRDGAATVPGLGVRYHGVNGSLRLAQDSILTDSLRIVSRFGDMMVAGGLRLERLTTPVLNLDLTARDFELIDVNNYLQVRSSGQVKLTGTVQHPVLTGSGRISNSVIYFADLVQKDVVNLEDPLFKDLVDTLALRKYSLGASFQSRFLDSLVVRDLQVEIGQGVWLRSAEANFQLEGSLQVTKSPFRAVNTSMYRFDGVLDVPRGSYTLKIGEFVNRTFSVDRGTVRYFGDYNAELDVEARYVVRTPQQASDEVPVIAHISGRLLLPELTLRTPPDRPPLSQPQLISLLILGTEDPGAAIGQVGTRQQAVAAAAIATSALSSELQRALISDIGLPFDMVEIRPGLGTSGLAGGSTGAPTQFAIGKALTSKLFVTANAGFCLGSSQATFSARNLGATLEYRFSGSLRALLAAEPVQSCLLRGVDVFGTAKRYQFGADLRWNRDF